MAIHQTELFAEILCRLPVKSIIRFTSVCKAWLSLIKSPNFIKLHLTQTLSSNKGLHLVLSSDSLHISEFDVNDCGRSISFSELNHPLKPILKMVEDVQDVELPSSCNGVLCITDIEGNYAMLFNPLTRLYWKVPLHPSPPLLGYHESVFINAFGCDSFTNEYKLLKVLKYSKEENKFFQAQLFNFRDCKWKRVEFLPYDLYNYYRKIFLFDDIAHFVVSKDLDFIQLFIVTFNFQEEIFSEMECPPHANCAHLIFFLNTLGGRLCMLLNYVGPVLKERPLDHSCVGFVGRGCALDHVDIWVMEVYGMGNSWVKLFSILDPQNLGIESMIWYGAMCSNDGKKLLLVVDDDTKLGWYDRETASFKRIATPKDVDPYAPELIVGSLVSLDYDKGKKEKDKERNDLVICGLPAQAMT